MMVAELKAEGEKALGVQLSSWGLMEFLFKKNPI